VTPEERHHEAESLITRVNAELIRVLALQEMWSRCRIQQDVLIAMGREDLKPGFLLVRDALHIDLIMSLVRLYDDPKRYIPASVPVLIKRLQEPAIRKLIDACPKRQTASECALRLYQTGSERRRSALRTLRDKVLAHNEIGNIEHGAEYGDETRLVVETAEIASQIDRAIRGQAAQFAPASLTWKWLADAYWSQTIAMPDCP
jgi:hypothetical protein